MFSDKIICIADELGKEKILFNYNFECDNMSCVVESLEKFTELAYGVNHFKLIAMQIFIILPNKNHIAVNYLSGFTASATTKILLETFIKKLGVEQMVNEQMNKDNVQTINNNTYVVNGNGNIVGNEKCNISDVKYVTREEKEESNSTLKDFFLGVFQGVVTNALWWFLSVVGVALVGFIAAYIN